MKNVTLNDKLIGPKKPVCVNTRGSPFVYFDSNAVNS